MTPDDLLKAIGREIDERREMLVDLCARFVAAPSMNPPGRTTEVADVLQSFLDAQGVPSERLAVDDEAANVVATLTGSQAGRHVIFNAHMDTMQAGDEKVWTVPILQQ